MSIKLNWFLFISLLKELPPLWTNSWRGHNSRNNLQRKWKIYIFYVDNTNLSRWQLGGVSIQLIRVRILVITISWYNIVQVQCMMNHWQIAKSCTCFLSDNLEEELCDVIVLGEEEPASPLGVALSNSSHSTSLSDIKAPLESNVPPSSPPPISSAAHSGNSSVTS